jgi:hypothetical protein
MLILKSRWPPKKGRPRTKEFRNGRNTGQNGRKDDRDPNKNRGKIKKLTETIEKIWVELQTVEASLYMEARKLQENLEVIEANLTCDTTLVGIYVKLPERTPSRSKAS